MSFGCIFVVLVDGQINFMNISKASKNKNRIIRTGQVFSIRGNRQGFRDKHQGFRDKHQGMKRTSMNLMRNNNKHLTKFLREERLFTGNHKLDFKKITNWSTIC